MWTIACAFVEENNVWCSGTFKYEPHLIKLNSYLKRDFFLNIHRDTRNFPGVQQHCRLKRQFVENCRSVEKVWGRTTWNGLKKQNDR